MESFSELVKMNRSYRRFDESSPVGYEQMAAIAANIRNIPSGTNRQALKVCISTSPETNGKIFPKLGWASLLSTWNGPVKGERPTAYFVIVCDVAIAKPDSRETDLGIAAQTLALATVEAGLGVCMVASFSKSELASALALPEHLSPMLVLAVGKPTEKVVMLDMASDGNTTYFRDRAGTHFVPKRSLDDLVIRL